ncbi:MAG: hypothetical protein MUO92_04395 [Dehalococcoidales bacterium]|nr:hypothetical protein [Dehalococcoidales bacterium]
MPGRAQEDLSGLGLTEIKEILLELHKLENVLEYVTGRLRHVFHQLMMLIKEEDLAKEDKLKKKATQAQKPSAQQKLQTSESWRFAIKW